jgi:hypothetical protein
VRRRAILAIAVAALALAAACHRDAASPPAAPAPPAPPAQPCGSRTCAADELCEDLYKGHRVDAEGRPLDHVQCVPLPDACRAAPTCACVTRYLAATHCDDGVPVRIDDYPR